MATRTLGHVTVTLPELDEPGLYLAGVASLDNPRGMVRDFMYGEADLRSLELTGTQLITGRVSGVRSQRVDFEAVNLHGVEIVGSSLGSVRWSDSRLTRVVLKDCRLMGAALAGITLDDVLFESCRLDYATLRQVRVTGPVAFVDCVLSEAVFTDCDVSGAVFSACPMKRTGFGAGRYQDTDLRGNDLSDIRGAGNLAKARIGHGQQAELAEALVRELGITVGDDV
ncbi:pentapeptide repeat-containing protein [Streptomyces fradiae]|uniref:pentapeptide repeat-containing protein n=1 Tax=Streptomyces fradiae TaxID=1906 RepID=UPI0036757FF8